MRRRRDVEADGLPVKLLVFDGFRYRTDRAWGAAFVEFRAARAAWVDEHEGAVLPAEQINGHCPFDRSRFERGDRRKQSAEGINEKFDSGRPRSTVRFCDQERVIWPFWQ